MVKRELLDRTLPQQEEPEIGPVRERIAGTPVRGRSSTTVDLRVRMLPDANYVRMGLEAHGRVAANTVADGGQALLRSRAKTRFLARKLIVVAPDGDVKMWPAVAQAHNRSWLVGMCTKYDNIPLISSMARSRALEEYQEKRPIAKAQVEYRVANRAMRRLDADAQPMIDRLENQVRSYFNRLQEFEMHAEPVQLQTTATEAVARLRLAGDAQLAAHTPRPQDLGDSLASLQVHESVFANLALGLPLAGQRLPAPDLVELFRTKFPGFEIEDVDVPAETTFHFDYEQAIQVQFHEGKVELTLSLSELVHEGEAVRNFKVHVYYRPEVEGTEARLVRDGVLGIEGRVNPSDRALLHNVFGFVFSEDEPVTLVQLDSQDRRLQGLMITQFVFEDGWAGMALGPERPNRSVQLYRSLR